MNTTLVVSLTDMRDFHRDVSVLYKKISALLAGFESPEKEFETRRELFYKNEPWRAYSVRMENKSMKIHLMRNGQFSLEIYGFQPRFVKPFNAKHGRYRNYFGAFDDLHECLTYFAKETYNLTLDYSGELF